MGGRGNRWVWKVLGFDCLNGMRWVKIRGMIASFALVGRSCFLFTFSFCLFVEAVKRVGEGKVEMCI